MELRHGQALWQHTFAHAQVPWHALRIAPVVVELSDVHIRLALLGEADLEPGPAGERAWAAKQAALAVAELAALAGGSDAAAAAAAAAGGVGAGGGRGEEASREKRGMLWSFLQHLVAMFVNKLQLRVRSVHVSLEVGDGNGGRGGATAAVVPPFPCSCFCHFPGCCRPALSFAAALWWAPLLLGCQAQGAESKRGVQAGLPLLPAAPLRRTRPPARWRACSWASCTRAPSARQRRSLCWPTTP